MKHEGQFSGGKIWGLGKKYSRYIFYLFIYLGMTTFNDGSNGFPRYEGFFQDCKLLKKVSCVEVVQKAQKVAFMARNHD
jgi:hypothetical protein